MTHILTEVFLENPLERVSEAVSMISSPQCIYVKKHSRLIFLLNGSYTIRMEGWGPQVFQNGDIIILPEGSALQQDKSPDKGDSRSHAFSLFCAPDQALDDPFTAFVRQYAGEFRFLPHGQTHEMRSLISGIREEAQNPLLGTPFKLNALARSLMVEVARQINHDENGQRAPTRSRSYITNQAKDYLVKNHKQSIRLSDIAWYLNLSEEHLCRLFKAETGMTIFHFLNWYRVEYSKEALMQSNRSIAKIAEIAGFSSAPLFSRQFKLHTGMSPMEYRMTHGGRFGLVHRFGNKV